MRRRARCWPLRGRQHERHSFGPRLTEKGAIFRLWAPAAQRVDVVLGDQAHPLKPGDDGWFAAEIAGVKAGATYRFRIDGKTDVPDPGSRFQPNDIAGPSEVINHKAYPWRATDWRGRPWEETVLIETHVGTFTPQGTYRAMIDKLDHLVATGITALELMPLADFAGKRNWGYDGVLWYAPDAMFGRPDDLKALIDEAHLRGLTVFLDVVYNHFGPEGNYSGNMRRPSSAMRIRRGARRSTITCRRCGPTRSRMPWRGCATIASMGCGSMPCMRSPNRARSRCCTS
jgi:maltooligosyltrehalose trehalohydrolase